MLPWTTLVLALFPFVLVDPLPGTSARYPIPPRPLRMLVEEADFIVTAKVVAADTGARPPPGTFPETKEAVGGATMAGGLSPTVVVLEVDGVLKGDPGTRRIEQTNYSMICPEPARYEVGTHVLAFLDRSGRPGAFVTHALSYGAKRLGDDDLSLYLARVKEQLAILAITDPAKRRVAEVEWLVKCAEHPATRWEGAYELAPDGDLMSSYDSRRTTDPFRFAGDLSADQRRRLLESLLAAKRFETGEFCLEELFRSDPEPRLLAAMVAQLRERAKADGEDHCYGDSLLLDRIARRDPRPKVQEVVRAYEARIGRSLVKEGDGDARSDLAKIVAQLLALY